MGREADLPDRLADGFRNLETALDRWEAEGDPTTFPCREHVRRLLRRLQRLDGVSATASEGNRGVQPRAPRTLVGDSAPMRAILDTVRRIGPRLSNILIEGESGTGKELVARAVHDASPQCTGRLVAVDCGTVSDSLLESELFGHRKGSFTGATSDRVGLFEDADQGSLFLDELANASPAFQTRLLRVLQEGEIRRVGENQSRRLRLRVIGATSGNLRRLVAEGRFREDLYYRLNVVTFEIPPLRRRREDIPVLVDHFLEQIGRRYSLPEKRFTQAAVEILLRYAWPGNVRELENVVERSLLLAPGDRITPDSLPDQLLDDLLQRPEEVADGNGAKTAEQLMLERALLEAGGDKTQAARVIGWHRSKLYRKLRRYGLPSDFGRQFLAGAARRSSE